MDILGGHEFQLAIFLFLFVTKAIGIMICLLYRRCALFVGYIENFVRNPKLWAAFAILFFIGGQMVTMFPLSMVKFTGLLMVFLNVTSKKKHS